MSELLPLNRSDIHLWYVRTEDAKRQGWIPRYHGLLSGDQRERHQRLVFEKDRDQFLIAHALVCTTLSRFTTVPPDAWRFHTNEFGKPAIDSRQNPLKLRFNVSHCDGLVMCGVMVGCDIGVDCENINRKVEIEQLASRCFSASEREYLESLPASMQTETFFRFWTLKEAYIKARGLGMSLSLQEFSFDIATAHHVSISFNPKIRDRPEAWQFVQPTLTGPFTAALAVNMPPDEKLSIKLRKA